MKRIFNFICTIGIMVFSVISYSFAYTQEQTEAYNWAYQNKIISQPNIRDANLNWTVTRQTLAKMVINYMENAVGIAWDLSDLCSFTDEYKITNDLKYYTKRICAYKIMWKNRSEFKPTQPVSRAQLWTVLSRVLWWNRHDTSWKRYYIYHLNGLQEAWVMKNIRNASDTLAKRWDVLIMLKRMYDKFGSEIYLNDWSHSAALDKPVIIEKIEDKTETSDNSNDDYTLNTNSTLNVIYTWKDWTTYRYDDKLLKLLGKTAKNKWESDLANYLKVETEYFKNGLDQLSDLDDEELLKSIWIDVNTIDVNNMTKQEKEDLIDKFKIGFGNIITENKNKNNALLKDLEDVTKNIKNDKFWLKEKYKKTKTFIEASNTFLDNYAESIYNLMEIALMDSSNSSSEEWEAEAFWLIWIALVYQEAAEKYQEYIEQRGVSTIKLLGIN